MLDDTAELEALPWHRTVHEEVAWGDTLLGLLHFICLEESSEQQNSGGIEE